MDTTVCIPTIPPRLHLVQTRALSSILSQTTQPTAISIAIDHKHEGAWVTRNRALQQAQTEWVAFLDDDDEFLPHHITLLQRAAMETGADVVWGWFDVVGGTDPFPLHRGKQWDIGEQYPHGFSHIFPITVLLRRELAMDAKFEPDQLGNWDGQDFPFWKKMWDAGAKFHAIPDTTWLWHHHSNNTSGLPNRW